MSNIRARIGRALDLPQMQLSFYKGQATGNDFVLVDNWAGSIRLSEAEIRALCDRRFGVGADGVIVLQPHATLAYTMVYYNADGPMGSMCGNGSRAAYALLRQLGRVPATDQPILFEAYDGVHEISQPNEYIRVELLSNGTVRAEGTEAWFVDTGSPHVVQWVSDAAAVNVARDGAELRYDARYAPGGTNVNFVSDAGLGRIAVRTYERGVEAETLSCGTGVAASALVAAARAGQVGAFAWEITTPGGRLMVDQDAAGRLFLIGPAVIVYQGSIDLGKLTAAR
jgi:diaminopimelate epimerase